MSRSLEDLTDQYKNMRLWMENLDALAQYKDTAPLANVQSWLDFQEQYRREHSLGELPARCRPSRWTYFKLWVRRHYIKYMGGKNG